MAINTELQIKKVKYNGVDIPIFKEGGLPTGFSAIARGTYILDSDLQGGSSNSSKYAKTVTHNLGIKPDLILFYAPNQLTATNSMLGMMWSDTLAQWKGTTYTTNVWYRNTNPDNVSGNEVTSSYGIVNVNETTFDIRTYSNSSSYYWRAGTYNWIAIKF